MTPPHDLHITTAADLDPTMRAQVVALAHEASQADGIFPLDDQVLFDLESSDPRTHLHLVAGTPNDPSPVGYAHLDIRSPDVRSAHVVVHPTQRRQGFGTLLLERLSELAGEGPDPRLRAWSHGDHPAAAALAASLGWKRVRDLWQMRLSLETPIGQPSYPPDVEVRTFVPGKDEEAWVDVNAAAFAHHAEQGRLTIDDLLQRERQPWFDPGGLFLAVRGREVLGSHWTKVHVDDDGEPTAGEVYVIGVRPSAQGLGLGKALTLTGLHHLRDKKLDVMLYADADNTAAIAVYERIGFTTSRVDVMYERQP